MTSRRLIPKRFGRLAVVAAALAAMLTSQASAADSPDLDQLEQQAFRAAVDRVAPSVVRIETVGGLQRVGGVVFGTGPTTGLVVDPEGYIVSSAFNFINRPASILVREADGQLKPAELVATDHARMLVLLKIETDKPLPVSEIADPGTMRVGQWTIGVGRTFAGKDPNMTAGVLSAVGRIWGKAIQTDAIVSPSNYGGPLIDVHGRVLGVIVPLSPQSDEEVAGVEWYDSGIGFAVPAAHVQEILPRLKKGEDLHPGQIGISFRSPILHVAEPVVGAARPNSPAYKAGLKSGDKIVEVDGRPVARAAEVKEQIAQRYAGDVAHLVVLRDEKRLEFDIELAAELPPYRYPFLGLLPMRAGEPGVAVRYVYPDGPAQRAGIEPGDVLAKLGDEDIADRAGLVELLAKHQPEEEVSVEVCHGGKSRSVTLTLAELPSDVPAGPLPAAHGQVEPGAERPQVGVVGLKIPEFDNEAFAYVPERYDPRVPHGVVVWLHEPGGFDRDALVKRWKPLCQGHDLILIAPKASDPERWKPTELALVNKLLDDVIDDYTTDPARVVVAGREGGGTLAAMVALRNRDLVRGLALVDAPLAGRPPENDPLKPLVIYVAHSEESTHAGAIQRGLKQLDDMKVPVTRRDLGEQSRELNDDEQAELGRWVDTLDKI
jgi:serine protease Do